jgi:4-aminobutyrate aminotransferase-like enzyme
MSMSNAEWLQRERGVLTLASHRSHDPKFGPVFSRGCGAQLWDIEGLDYIDFTCGYSASNFGHAFPPLVETARRQLGQLTHLTQEPHVHRAPLAEKLIHICGFSRADAKVHFNATGSRAVETAWKAARSFRPGKLISLAPSYHGRSLATSALSDAAPTAPAFLPDTWHTRRPAAEFAYCSDCELGLSYPNCQTRCLDSLLAQIAADSSSISAVIVEPALGARGYVFPPAEYWQRLRKATSAAGIVLIADEIQMGLGRAGGMLLSNSQGWQADLVVLGKSLGGGIVPISSVVGRREVIDALPVGSESETFACTPLAAAVALEVIHQLTSPARGSDSNSCEAACGETAIRPNSLELEAKAGGSDRVDEYHGTWIARGREVGQGLRETLHILRDTCFPGLLVEGQGATAVAEFVRCGDSLELAQRRARAFAEACRAQRVLVHFTGPLSTRIALIPPFTTTPLELEMGSARLLHAAYHSLQAR